VVYGASHRTGQRPGKTGPPRPFCYAAQSEPIPALKALRMTIAPNPPWSLMSEMGTQVNAVVFYCILFVDGPPVASTEEAMLHKKKKTCFFLITTASKYCSTT
jgi:hypothetical protein